MDRLIKRLDAERDADLMLCAQRGIAYQRDMNEQRIAYDAAYLAHYDDYASGPIAGVLNASRCELLARHIAAGASVLDVGAASGLFVRAARAAGFAAMGFDVIPEAVARLSEAGLYAEAPEEFDALTFWDSIEHMEEPELWLGRVRKGAIVLVGVPVFEDLQKIRQCKHYKPGEHLYYWSGRGFVEWMALYGFRLLECSSHETDAGRESIGAFAFCRDLPDFRDHIAAYSEMHATRHYGSSATELHLQSVAKVVRAMRPRSILDYGCGRSDLAAHFWLDGARRIERYDPAIPMWKRMPEGQFDLVLVCDVMEHIPMMYVDKVLMQLRRRGTVAFFSISTKLARAKLPDGTNAHVTLMRKSEWIRWIENYFGEVSVLHSTLDFELVLLAGKKIAAPIRFCQCGGEIVEDSFAHPRKPVEHFLRCLGCNRIEELPKEAA